jgi:HSP20 family protein
MLDQQTVPTDPTWAPPMDLVWRENQLVIRAALPGVADEDVDIRMTNVGLRIIAEQICEVEDAPFKRARVKHRRLVRLPAGVKSDEVRATFNDGMLEIVVPLHS